MHTHPSIAEIMALSVREKTVIASLLRCTHAQRLSRVIGARHPHESRTHRKRSPRSPCVRNGHCQIYNLLVPEIIVVNQSVFVLEPIFQPILFEIRGDWYHAWTIRWMKINQFKLKVILKWFFIDRIRFSLIPVPFYRMTQSARRESCVKHIRENIFSYITESNGWKWGEPINSQVRFLTGGETSFWSSVGWWVT